MKHRFKAIGLNTTPSYLWVYAYDRAQVVPRRIGVNVPWTMLADVYRDVSEAFDREFARRVQAEAEASQWTLPGID